MKVTKRSRRRTHHANEIRDLKAKLANVSTNTATSCGAQQARIAHLSQRQTYVQTLQSKLNGMMIDSNEKLAQRVTQLSFMVFVAIFLSFGVALILGGSHG